MDSIRSQDMTKYSVNPTVRTLYISMCKGGGSPYKLVGTGEKSRILLDGTFQNYQYFWGSFFVRSPTVPPPIPPPLMWKTKPNHFRLWDLSFVRVRLPSLSKSFQPSHKRSPWKSDKNLGDPSLTRSEHQYFEHTVLSRHRPPFRPPARSNARPPACQTAVCLPA